MSQLAGDGLFASQLEDDEPVRPPDYDEIRSVLEFLGPLFKWVGVFVAATFATGLLASVVSTAIEPMLLLVLLTGLYCAWRIVAAHWAWKHLRIMINGGTGLITVQQKGPLILGLPDSPDDTASIDAALDTPARKWYQREPFFNCNTIILKLPSRLLTLTNVKHPEHFEVIQAYVRSMKKQGLIQAKRTNALLEQLSRGVGQVDARLERWENPPWESQQQPSQLPDWLFRSADSATQLPQENEDEVEADDDIGGETNEDEDPQG